VWLGGGGLRNAGHELSLGLVFLFREDRLERTKVDPWPPAGGNEREDTADLARRQVRPPACGLIIPALTVKDWRLV